MLIGRTVEYFLYLVIFVLYFKFLECAVVNDMKSTATQKLSSVDILTTAESSWNNEANSKINKSRVNSGVDVKRSLEECNNYFSWMCFKLEFVGLLESLNEQKELMLLNGISVVKDPQARDIKTSDLMAEVARSYPHDPNARLNGFIISKIHNLLQTHYLRFKLIDDQTFEEARSVIETGRKDRFGKKGGVEALLAAGLMMKGTLMAIGMGGIALIAGKALITALMALTMSAVVGLKSLAGGGGGKSHTYEIVTKPLYTSSHSHSVSHDDGEFVGHSDSGYGGYDRTLSLNLPQSHRGRD